GGRVHNRHEVADHKAELEWPPPGVPDRWCDVESSVSQGEGALECVVSLKEAEPVGQPRHFVGVALGLPTGQFAHSSRPPLLACTSVQGGRGPVFGTPLLGGRDEGAQRWEWVLGESGES